MRVPVSWLREFVAVEMSVEELASVLTSRGAKVEGIEWPWAGLAGVVTARVLEVADHPGSEKLCVTRVDAGTGVLEVVAGVRNMRPGDIVPLAPPGSRVPTHAEPLGRRSLRGVVSNGMLCSPKELGISADHGGIFVLPPGTPVGVDVKTLFGLEDAVLDIEVKANRPDLLSVVGVAREVAGATGVAFVLPRTVVAESAELATDMATVRIADLERCPRYLARVIRGVTIGPSPIAVQARLTAAGMRPLSNVVDATNYAMLEMGQPLHAFDLDRLAGHGIVVRRAAEGERLVTLDDVERVLSVEDLVIADLEKGVAIAGVMGSAPAEVSAATRDVLLESAYFERRGVIRTSRRLELRTEASARFERGTDPEAVPAAAARAATLMAAWAGGSVLAGAVQAGAAPERRLLTVRPERASLLLGLPVSAEDVTSSFARIGIMSRVTGEMSSGAVAVEVPGWRPDLEGEVDLIEEVIRVQGYDRVGSTMPSVRQAGGVPDKYAFRRRASAALARSGLRETLSFSFGSQADLDLMQHDRPVRVRNPLSADDGYLRTSLVPGLLRALRTNRSRQVRSAALFEIGHVFRLAAAPDGDESAVEEHEAIAVAMMGVLEPGIHGDHHEADFFDAKGSLEVLMDALAIGSWELVDLARPRSLLHPARSAAVSVGQARVGVVGELHPRVAASMDLPAPVALLEVNAEALRLASQVVHYREIPRFPPVRRDLAFVVDAAVPVAAIEDGLARAGSGLVGSVLLFDVFEGAPLPPGKKNVAFSIEFRADDRTLTDAEVSAVVGSIAEWVRVHAGGELRTG